MHYIKGNENVVIYTDKIDKRWMEMLYSLFEVNKFKWKYDSDQALYILHACEPKSKRLDDLLISLTRKTMPNDQGHIFKLIMERQIKDRFEIIYSTMGRYAPRTYSYSLNWLKHTGFWEQFPKEYAIKFRALYEKNPLQIYEDVANEIENSNG